MRQRIPEPERTRRMGRSEEVAAPSRGEADRWRDETATAERVHEEARGPQRESELTPPGGRGEPVATRRPEPRRHQAGEVAAPERTTPQGERPSRGTVGAEGREHFLPDADRERLLRRWDEVQADFVDRPRQSVGGADALLRECVDRFCQAVEAERAAIEARAGAGSDAAATEDLRLALRGYRALLERLLTA